MQQSTLREIIELKRSTLTCLSYEGDIEEEVTQSTWEEESQMEKVDLVLKLDTKKRKENVRPPWR